MKAFVVPYAYPEECTWAEEYFPKNSIAALPVCDKPIVAYILDELSRLGISEVMVLDHHYDRHLAGFIGDGSKWGLTVIYTGSDAFKSEEELCHRHDAFIGHEGVVFVLGNTIIRQRISSLQKYYDLNMALLQDQHDCVLPGYSAEPGVFIGSDVVLQNNADVTGPVCLGDGVNVGRSAKISKSVLGSGCVIDRGAKIHESIIFPNTYIGKHIETIGKIISGSRIIDPSTGGCIDLAGDGISESLDANARHTVSLPASAYDLHSYSYTGLDDSQTNEQLASVLSALAHDIASLDFPRLAGVYLGGGYGRGEGGAPLYNDLDFFPLVHDLQNEEEREEIQVALNALGFSYGMKLGIHVDFCRPKTRSDFKKDERRIMIQEFIRGNKAIYGESSMLSFIKEYPPEDIHVSEGLRLLVNRGMGLYLAQESDDQGFINRNINKAVLGSGDAILVAERRYRWNCREREKELGNDEYSRAVAFKFHPVGEPNVSWEVARLYWLYASEKVMLARSKELEKRTLRSAVRYIYRTHRVGPLLQLGLDPLMRIFIALKQALEEKKTLSPEIINDWKIFN